MAIDRIEVCVTDLPIRLQRELSSGPYDTGASGTLLGKPVLVKIHADGVTGYGQIRPISPGHFIPDTVHSMVGAIKDVYGPKLIGTDVLDFESDAGHVRPDAARQHERARGDRPRAARRRRQGVESAGLQAAGRAVPGAHTARVVGEHGGGPGEDDRRTPSAR